jgi:hypothetical protein
MPVSPIFAASTIASVTRRFCNPSRRVTRGFWLAAPNAVFEASCGAWEAQPTNIG